MMPIGHPLHLPKAARDGRSLLWRDDGGLLVDSHNDPVLLPIGEQSVHCACYRKRVEGVFIALESLGGHQVIFGDWAGGGGKTELALKRLLLQAHDAC